MSHEEALNWYAVAVFNTENVGNGSKEPFILFFERSIVTFRSFLEVKTLFVRDEQLHYKKEKI